MNVTTVDLKAAVERVRKWKAGIALRDIYPETKDRAAEIDMLALDWRDLALTYIATLPAEQEVKSDGR